METMAKDLRYIVYAALMAALVIAGSYVSVPIGVVPFTLQTLFVLLTGLLLGKFWGVMSIATYLIAGASGLPVFASGKGGLAVLFGPTGGFLFGFLIAVFVTGMIADQSTKLFAGDRKKTILFDVIALVLGTITIFIMGVPWFKIITGHSWAKTLAWTLYPFIPGAILKAAAAVAIAQIARPILKRYAEAR